MEHGARRTMTLGSRGLFVIVHVARWPGTCLHNERGKCTRAVNLSRMPCYDVFQTSKAGFTRGIRARQINLQPRDDLRGAEMYLYNSKNRFSYSCMCMGEKSCVLVI